ncbi:hypothetical protein BOTBODRAFT_182798 [Botryobasidium botryosum FD-172 SS1]|uniref:DUF6534 domain-containing protein n=1 Tax=Botryobasidium botryosum (strain FD-172 SS1) TaxID=930990 RepID=A0A067N3D2_BOTB1|nr:hypothetical protein BOTBODRAFT_182798 [Botryobasidium botryosum FD-172 SS1]
MGACYLNCESTPTVNALNVLKDAQLITGPLLLGYLFNWGLFGLLILQVYIYYLSFPKDHRYIKALVYTVFVADCLQTIITAHSAWQFFSTGWGDVNVFQEPSWSWIAVPLSNGFVSASVQCFFAYRIWVLSESRIVSTIVAVLAVMQGVSALVSGIQFQAMGDASHFCSPLPSTIHLRLPKVWLSGTAVTDVIITVTMIHLLKKAVSGNACNDLIISNLVRVTATTGAVTISAAVVQLALMLAKLYTNTLLCTLNIRSPVFRGSYRATAGGNSGPDDLWHAIRKAGMNNISLQASSDEVYYQPAVASSNLSKSTVEGSHQTAPTEPPDISQDEIRISATPAGDPELGTGAGN